MNLHTGLFFRVVDIQVVEPLLAHNVPTRRKHNHPAIGQRGQVKLDAAVAQGVLDAMLHGLAGKIRFGDVESALALAQGIRLIAEGYRAAGKIPLHARRGGRLHHFAMPRMRPFAMNFRMAFRAGCGPGITRSAGGGAGCGRNQQE